MAKELRTTSLDNIEKREIKRIDVSISKLVHKYGHKDTRAKAKNRDIIT